MEAEILDRLRKMQDAHNELGALYGEAAKCSIYSGLQTLKEVSNQQIECISDLRQKIQIQRDIIRKLSPSVKKINPEPYKLESILMKNKNLFKNNSKISLIAKK